MREKKMIKRKICLVKEDTGPVVQFMTILEDNIRILRIEPKEFISYFNMHKDLKSQHKFFNIDLQEIDDTGDLEYNCDITTMIQIWNQMTKSNEWIINTKEEQEFFFGVEIDDIKSTVPDATGSTPDS
jgi:hypothetical protein